MGKNTEISPDKAPDRGPKVRLLTRDALDKRTRAARLFASIAREITADLGGEAAVSAITRELIEGFAGASVNVHALNAKLLLGQKIDLSEFASAISSLVRLANHLGTARRPRDVTPDLHTYLEQTPELEGAE